MRMPPSRECPAIFADSRVVVRLGVTRATSPDVRSVDQSAYGGSVPAVLRSLDAGRALGILPPLANNAGFMARATPR